MYNHSPVGNDDMIRAKVVSFVQLQIFESTSSAFTLIILFMDANRSEQCNIFFERFVTLCKPLVYPSNKQRGDILLLFM